MGSIRGECDPEERSGRVWIADKDEKNPDTMAAWIRAETDEGVPVLSRQLSSSGSREDGSQHLEDWGKTGLLFTFPGIGVSTWLLT